MTSTLSRSRAVTPSEWKDCPASMGVQTPRNGRFFFAFILFFGVVLLSIIYISPSGWVMLVGPDMNCSHIPRDTCNCDSVTEESPKSHMLSSVRPESLNQAEPEENAHQVCSTNVRSEVLDVKTIYKYQDKVNLRIIVITYDRSSSLQSTLNSLQDLELDGHTASVEIWLDRSKKGSIDCATLAVAVQFCWKHGPVTVHIQEKHQGLVGQWLKSWRPPPEQDSKTDELAIFLEDDVDLGKFGYRYLRAAHVNYSKRRDVNGYTLTDEYAIYFANKDVEKQYNEVVKDEVTFGYRIVGSWAFAPKPNVWSEFQDFYLSKLGVKDYHPYTKEAPVHTGWYKSFVNQKKEETMWTMWFINYTFAQNLFTVYPRFHKKFPKVPTALAFCRRVKGLHQPSTPKLKPRPMMKDWDARYVDFNKDLKRFHYNGTLVK